MAMVNEHVYRNGLRQRWYSSEQVARLVLSRISREKRGAWTMDKPLQTSPGIWRVDDKATETP